MRFEDVLSLAQAGFSKAEILKISEAIGAAPEPPTAATPASGTGAAMSNELLEGLVGKLNAAVDAMHQSAIAASRMPEPPTADDVLASILAPEKRDTPNG